MADRGPNDPGALAAFLNERDAACPNCGYNLRGLQGGACPECSQPLVLSVALEHPVSRAWLACILPLWICGGAFGLGGLIVWCVAGDEVLSDLRRSWVNEEAFWLGIYPVVAGVVLLLPATMLTRRSGRKWLTRRSPRWPVAAVCTAAGVLVVLVWAGWLWREVN